MEAAERFGRGESSTVIAKDLRVSVRSVQRWRRVWADGGSRALRSSGPASLPRLSNEQFTQLERELAKGPAAHGWEDQRWTLNRVKTVIGRRFHLTYTIQGDEYDIRNLALALQGSIEEVAGAAGGTVDDTPEEEHAAIVITSGIIQTMHPRISTVVVKQGVATLVVNDDYVVVDAVRGLIQQVATGDWDPADPVSVEYTYASTGATETLHVGTESVKEVSIYLAANNGAGENRDLRIWRASAAANGEVNFIGDDFGSYGLTITALDDSAGLFGGSAESPLADMPEKPVAGA